MLHLADTSQYVDVPASPAYNLGAAFTVEAIVKLDTLASGSQVAVCRWGDMGNLKASWNLNVANQGRLRFSIHDGSVTEEIETPTAVVSAGNLYHLTAVYENKNVYLYVDGNLVHSATTQRQPQPSSNYPIRIGLSGSGAASLQGSIAEVRFWGIARTVDEIKKTVRRPLKGDETGLLGYWPLDEKDGGVIVDNSPTLNHGVVYGSPSRVDENPYYRVKYLVRDGAEIKKYVPPQNIVPAMTSNTQPAGIARASSELTEYGHYAYSAFDRAYKGWLTTSASVPQWVEYEFPEPQTVVMYRLSQQDLRPVYFGRSPKSWILQGSNDGVTWANLHTVTNFTGWDRINFHTFYVDYPGSYKRYRLYITAHNGTSDYFGIREFEMYSSTVGEWVTVSGDLSDELFITEGMDEVPGLPESLRHQLSGMQLLVWSEIPNDSHDNISLTAVPVGRLIFPTGDISLSSVDKVHGFALAATQPQTGPTRITPYMAAHDLPTPFVISASSEYLGGQWAPSPAYCAFDGSLVEQSVWATEVPPTPESPAWIMVDLGEAKSLYSYSIAARSAGGYVTQLPKTWVLQGSNDGLDWVDLDVQTDQINWAPSQKRTFLVSSLQEFRYYRLLITEHNGYPGGMAIGEIELIGGVRYTGLVRLITSVDSGQTWKTWNEETASWDDLDQVTPAEVKARGMSPDLLNNLTQTEWDALLDGLEQKKIRFAYYIEQESASEEAGIDKLSVTFDMKGSWDGAVLGQEYTYGYPTNTTLTIKLMTDGDYKINY